MKKIWIALLLIISPSLALSEIPAEVVPSVKTLPGNYPDSWIFAHDANFNSLIAGKVVLLDVAADGYEYKGAVDAAQFATFIESRERPELYVAETFYSRGTGGTRTDVVSIYDKSSLNKTGEIILPNNNRAQIVTNRYSLQLVDNDRYLLVFNFTPASSVSIIDIAARKLLGEIEIPGCSMVYPTGQRGFSSLCGDGSFVSVRFDESGKEVSRAIVPPFFSVDDDPVFDKPVYIGKTAYFISYKSKVYPVDMSGDKPVVAKSWSLVTAKQAKKNWRPSGWQIGTSDAKETLYVIMSENGFDGSHKSGGEQIWVANVNKQKVTKTIATETSAFSIEMTPGDQPLLVATNTNMLIDVYTPAGKLLRTFSLGDIAMPFILHSKR